MIIFELFFAVKNNSKMITNHDHTLFPTSSGLKLVKNCYTGWLQFFWWMWTPLFIGVIIVSIEHSSTNGLSFTYDLLSFHWIWHFDMRLHLVVQPNFQTLLENKLSLQKQEYDKGNWNDGNISQFSCNLETIVFKMKMIKEHQKRI